MVDLEKLKELLKTEDGKTICKELNIGVGQLKRVMEKHSLSFSLSQAERRAKGNLKWSSDPERVNKRTQATKKTNLAKYGVESPLQNKEIKDRVLKTSLERYGGVGLASNKIKEKAEATNLERYGVKSSLSNSGIIEKRLQTNLRKYGGKSPMSSNSVRDKVKSTTMEKYGVTNISKLEEVKEAKKATYLSHFGVESPLLDKSVKEKIKNTLRERYGVENPGQINGHVDKLKKTSQERYGVDFPMQNQEIYSKYEKTCLEKYGFPTTAQVPEIIQRVKDSVLEKYGVTCVFQLPEHQPRGSNSKPNRVFSQILDKYGIAYEREYTLSNNNIQYTYDFKVEDTLIEINPSATHSLNFSPFQGKEKSLNYHLDKQKLASDLGFRVLMVWDWDDPDKIARSLKITQRIFGRKTDVREISSTLAQGFIADNHFQGRVKGITYSLGLYLDGELVQTMVLGQPRYNKKYQWELLRLCSKIGRRIIGGTEKLWKYFLSTKKPESVISYCDNSKFTGEVYTKLGFTQLKNPSPSIHWYNTHSKTHLTDNLVRQLGVDKLLGTDLGKGSSNEEILESLKFFKIADCGQTTYIIENFNS